MGFIERYSDYLKDNPHGYWFKSKVYGWGWVPVQWQGWVLLAAFVAILVWIVASFLSRTTEPTHSEVHWFLFQVVVWIFALVASCWATGEPPKWHWGIPD